MSKQHEARLARVLSQMHAPPEVANEAELRISSTPMASLNWKAARDVIVMPARTIVLRGPYLRHVREDDEEFKAFLSAVRKNQDIGAPVGVRILDGEPVLTYGMRRWKAACLLGLHIHARNYGAMNDAESLQSQMLENELRSSMTAFEKAWGFYTIEKGGLSRAEIMEKFGRTKGYYSVHIRAGEALDLLPEETRLDVCARKIALRPIIEAVSDKTLTAQQRLERLLAIEESREEEETSHTGPVASREERDRVLRLVPEKRRAQVFDTRINTKGGGETTTIRWKDKDIRAVREAGRDTYSEFARGLAEAADRFAARMRKLLGDEHPQAVSATNLANHLKQTES